MAEENQGTQTVNPQENRKPNTNNNRRPNTNSRGPNPQATAAKPNSNSNKNNRNRNRRTPTPVDENLKEFVAKNQEAHKQRLNPHYKLDLGSNAKIRITPLGGLGEIGGNITVF